tara:strand:- start:295 stop:531 length:237 start_codon:yes stop_codon:yes gene_type:complete
MKDISLTDLSIIVSIILIPSWTTAYFTDKVVYVIPMLAVTTFVVAQVMQHRNNRRLDKDEFNEFKKDEGMKDDGSVHE